MKFSFLISFFFFAVATFAQSVGSKVQMMADDKQVYTGVIKEISNNRYRVKYDGYEFEAWLTADQFTLVPANQNHPANVATTAYAQELTDLFNFGKTKGWTTPVQERAFLQYVVKLPATDQQRLLQFLKQATTQSARFFVLKSLLAGDNFTVLQTFLTELNNHPESVQQERCLITNYRSIIQQWQFSCSVTSVQTYLADLSPRYAWDVKKVNNFDVVANDPANPMAQQQKLLLEKYGGGASARGDYSGKAIGLLEPLNQLVGPTVGARFYAQQITGDLREVFPKIRQQIDAGYLVPLLINFEGSEGAHFIMVMRYQFGNAGYRYLIYDPWVGLCDFVSETNLLNGSLAPMDTAHKISIGYYYPTVPLSKEETEELHQRRKQNGF